MRPTDGMEGQCHAPDTTAALDAAIADLFTLDRRAEPAEDLSGHPCSGECTDNGCSRPSTC
jgi:hypothetical protein